MVPRRPPENLADSDIELFASAGVAEQVGPRIEILHNTTVHSFGILIDGWHVLPASFGDYLEGGDWKLDSQAHLSGLRKWRWPIRARLMDRFETCEGPLIWFTDTYSHMYFHWIAETLPRLCYALEHYPGVPVLAPERLLGLDYVSSSLRMLGVEDLRTVTDGSALRVGKLLLSHRCAPIDQFHPKSLDDVRRLFRIAMRGRASVTSRSRRIFISRRRARARRIVNEAELERLLQEFGFECVCMEDLPFETQVGMCAEASIIAGLHGAGLANAIFMKEGGAILELRHEGSRHTGYWRAANALGHKYFYVNCPPTSSSSTVEKDRDVMVPITKVNEVLRRVVTLTDTPHADV